MIGTLLTILALITGTANSTSIDKGSPAITLNGATYYPNIHSVFVAVDEGPTGAKEFRSSVESLSARYTLDIGDVKKLSGNNATRKGIHDELTALAKRSTSEDRVVVDIVGHGHLGKDKLPYFEAMGCSSNVQDNDPALMPMDEIIDLFKAIPAKHKWLILDACYAGSLKARLTVTPSIGGNLSLAKEKPGAAIWLGSYEGETTTFRPNGNTSLHDAILSLQPKFNQDLEDLEYAVSRSGGSLIAGGLEGSHRQMFLGHSSRSGTEGAPEKGGEKSQGSSTNYDIYDRKSVEEAVVDLEKKLASPMPDEQRARLQVECALAHLSCEPPTKAHIEKTIDLLMGAKDSLEGWERLRATMALANTLFANNSLLGQKPADSKGKIALAKDLYQYVVDHAHPDEATETTLWAEAQVGLGNVMALDHLSGDPSAQEAFYKKAETVLSPDLHPSPYARVQLLLASAEYQRLTLLWQTKHKKADHAQADARQEKAFACLNKAGLIQQRANAQFLLAYTFGFVSSGIADPSLLDRAMTLVDGYQEVFTEKAHPILWAKGQLRKAYILNRFKTDHANNLKKAMTYLQSAETYIGPDTFPVEWESNAEQQLWRLAMRDFPAPPADRLKQAETLFKRAESAILISTHREQYASLHLAMLQFYNQITPRDRTTLNKAEACAAACQKVWTQKERPRDWGSIEKYLGGFYQLIENRTADDLSKAESHYDNSLLGISRTDYPDDWADLQLDVANFHADATGFPIDENSPHFAKAVSHFNEALSVLKTEDQQLSRAIALDGLAQFYMEAGGANDIEAKAKPNLLALAIANFQAELDLTSKESDEAIWVSCQLNIANCYFKIPSDRKKNLLEAQNRFQEVLNILTPEPEHISWAVTVCTLADILVELGQKPKAVALLQESEAKVKDAQFAKNLKIIQEKLKDLGSVTVWQGDVGSLFKGLF